MRLATAFRIILAHRRESAVRRSPSRSMSGMDLPVHDLKPRQIRHRTRDRRSGHMGVAQDALGQGEAEREIRQIVQIALLTARAPRSCWR